MKAIRQVDAKHNGNGELIMVPMTRAKYIFTCMCIGAVIGATLQLALRVMVKALKG